MKQHVRLLLLGALLSTAPALGQITYNVTQTSQAYVPLAGATDVTGQFGSLDDSKITIPLGFSFPYYGNNYTQVTVSTNGVLVFNDSGTSSYLSNRAIPATSGTPKNFITPWWDDLEGHPGGQVRYLNPTPSEIVIEYSNWGRCCTPSSSPTFSFQVHLYASGMFQVHYGTKTGPAFSDVGHNGFENSDGTLGGSFFACGGTSGGCADSTWPTNTLFTVGEAPIADIYVEQVNTSNRVKSGSNLTFTVSPAFRNFGLTAANNFHWKAYLSTDRSLDAQDRLVFTSTSAVSLAARGTATANANVSVTNLATGQYYVLIEADPAPAGCTTNCGAVQEFTETNNVGSSADHFTFGIDLVAGSITGSPGTLRPGDTATLQAQWRNDGTDPAATPNNAVEYTFVLSVDDVFDGNDFVFPVQGTEAATVGASFSRTYTLTIPQSVPGGTFHWGLRVDPRNQVVEANEANNVVFASSTVLVHQADIVPSSADVTDRYTFSPTRRLFIDETARMTVKLDNTGGAEARNFRT
ncbi:MAG: CARDB domain-containing protein, partial [Myxococcaceae bacterium]